MNTQAIIVDILKEMPKIREITGSRNQVVSGMRIFPLNTYQPLLRLRVS